MTDKLVKKEIADRDTEFEMTISGDFEHSTRRTKSPSPEKQKNQRMDLDSHPHSTTPAMKTSNRRF